MSDVVVCGPASWNEIVHVDALPEPRSQTIFAAAAYSTLGGTSAGKALHLTDLRRSVTLRTRVGTDDDAPRILAALARAGVATEAERVPGPSERHVNLMAPSGERLSIYASVTADPPGAPHLPPLGAARALVLDLAPWTRQLALALPRGASPVPVWTDLHDYDGRAEFHRPFVDAATHVVLSDAALGDPLTFLHHLVDEGVQLAVCTLGARGAVAVDAGHREWRVGAEPVEDVVDTNGAGDAFVAGLLDATLGGADLPVALKAGSRQAVRALRSRHLSPLLDGD